MPLAARGSHGPLLTRLAARLEARVGIRPPGWLLSARAERRAAELGRPLPAYLQGLLEDEPEIDRLVEALRVGETRFFRHPAQLARLGDGVLPGLRARAAAEGRALRAWSAGCATGEEAWTLAMLLAGEDAGGGAPTPVAPAPAAPTPVAPTRPAGPSKPGAPEVLGTDLSEAALRRAEAGVYGIDAAALVPPGLLARYLRPHDARHLEVAPALRAAVEVRFRRHNLLGERYPGPFDLILCRNVLIYFEEGRRRQIAERLRGQLSPGGCLLLGPAEDQADDAAALVTARPSPAVPSETTGSPLPPSAPCGRRAGGEGRAGTVPDRSAARPANPPAPVLRLIGSYGDGERLKEELRPHLAGGQALTIDLDGADYLGDPDGRVLRRAADLLDLHLRSGKPSVRRWLRRHRLDAGAGEGGRRP